jgi:uncharacterized protein YqfB (UPF0267 family)
MQRLIILTIPMIAVAFLYCGDDTGGGYENYPDAGNGTETDGPGQANSDTITAATGAIVISEFMADAGKVSDNDGEWVELYNPGETALDLSGWTLKDADGDSHILSPDAPLVIAAKGYLVLARNENSGTNGGLTVDYQYADFNLANSTDEIIIVDATGQEVDRVAYTSDWQISGGISLGLKDATKDNSVYDNWCYAAEAWSGSKGDKGSPGSEQTCGSAPPPPKDDCPHKPTSSISFNESLCPGLASGAKTITLRNNHRSSISEGDWTKLVCSTSKTTFETQITVVRLTTWGEITAEEYKADGFSSQDNMMQIMKQYYPNITLTSNATVYRWESVAACL